ncbi:MAG: SRPBCC family protein [Gemmatimonadaceae bacterium]|nr:SRPBCC family protein [Gemmatimonadaceae bacterium]
MLKLILGLLGTLVLAVALVTVWGSRLPREHVASRVLHLAQPRDSVWSVLTDYAGQASWRTDISAVRRQEGASPEVWVETGSNGEMPLATTVSEPPSRLIRTIADSTLPFGGSWTYELAVENGGTRLTITEAGEVYHPIFRFVSHYFMSPAGTIEVVMKALAARFGEPPRIE